MTVSLLIKPEKLEPVYGWLEANGGAKVQLWGWETGRRAALLAYSDGGEDGFGWSNWASSAAEDPSGLTTLFDQLELTAESDVATKLNATFLGTFTVAQDTPFG
jgi:hypothetical protein